MRELFGVEIEMDAKLNSRSGFALLWRTVLVLMAALMVAGSTSELTGNASASDLLVRAGFFFIPGLLWLFAAVGFMGAEPVRRRRQFLRFGMGLYLAWVAISLVPGVGEAGWPLVASAVPLLWLAYRAGMLIDDNLLQDLASASAEPTKASIGKSLRGWLSLPLRPGPALLTGMVAILASLKLAMGPNGTRDSGWQMLSGEATWVTAEYGAGTAFPIARSIVAAVGRTTYAGALLLALVSLFLLLPRGRRMVSSRGKSWLATGSFVLVSVVLTDLFFGWTAFLPGNLFGPSTPGTKLSFFFALALWVAAPLLCLLPRTRADRSLREAFFWLFLPMLFVDLHSVVFLAGFEMSGFICYLVGTLLCSLGIAQIAWSARAEKQHQEGAASDCA